MHQREIILDAVISELKANVPLVNSRVFKGRIYPFEGQELPGLSVYLSNEDAELLTTAGPRVSQRTLDLMIVIFERYKTEWGELEIDKRPELIISRLNDIGLEIEDTMSANPRFKGLMIDNYVSNYEEVLNADQTERPMEHITGVGTVTYKIIYDVIEPK